MDFAAILKKLQEQRDALVAKMMEVHKSAEDEGRVFSEAEQGTFDQLAEQIEGVDKQIKSTRNMERLLGTAAKPVNGEGSDAGKQTPGGGDGKKAATVPYSFQNAKSNLPKGTVFTRYAMALAASKGNLHMAQEIAKNQWGDSSPEVHTILKAAVAAGSTTDANWAKPLVEYRNATEEFIELLRPETILGKMSGFRRVPFNIRIPRQTAGSTVGWVGEAAPKPVGRLSFDSITVPETKIAGIVVITQELARFSQPSAEALVRQDMIASIAQFIDQQLIDPTVAGTAGVSPASLTNGVTPIASTGATVDAIIADTNKALLQLSTALIPLQNWYWIMNPRTFIYLQTLRTAQDVYAFPELQQNPPRFRGYPVVVSTGVGAVDPDGAGTEGVQTTLTLIAANEILLADDGQVLLDTSTEAAVAMDTAGAGTLTSLWQNNLIGIRAERFIHWLKRNAAAVAVISEIDY